jgi:hypothetical protein
LQGTRCCPPGEKHVRGRDPEPSWVAGFNTWKALGRPVAKGQRERHQSAMPPLRVVEPNIR